MTQSDDESELLAILATMPTIDAPDVQADELERLLADSVPIDDTHGIDAQAILDSLSTDLESLVKCIDMPDKQTQAKSLKDARQRIRKRQKIINSALKQNKGKR